MNSQLTNRNKKPKENTTLSMNPGTSRTKHSRSAAVKHTTEPLCPLLAKDSEWVDILQTGSTNASKLGNNIRSNVPDEEVECEDGPQMKPLAIMFPGILDKDPQTLQGILTRALSTTEVTRHLVDLGQKANFTRMKKADRLIPPDKQWMATLPENDNSYCSVDSNVHRNSLSNGYEADSEITVDYSQKKVKKKNITGTMNQSPNNFRS